jgi:hypothetical protein
MPDWHAIDYPASGMMLRCSVSRRHPPDGATQIVGDQQGAGAIKSKTHQPEGAPARPSSGTL